MPRSLGRTCAECAALVEDEALTCDACGAEQPAAGDPTVVLVPLRPHTVADDAAAAIERASWTLAGRLTRGALLSLLFVFMVLVSAAAGAIAYSVALMVAMLLGLTGPWVPAVSGLLSVAMGVLTLFSMDENAKVLERVRTLLGPAPTEKGPPARLLPRPRKRTPRRRGGARN